MNNLYEVKLELLTSALDQLPVMIWKINAFLKCEYVNKSWQKYTGITFEEATTNGMATVVHPDDLKMIIDNIDEANRNKTSFEFELRIMRHDGIYRWCLLLGTPYYNNNGEFDGFIGLYHDISERRRLERRSKDNEELFKTIFEQSPVGITYGTRNSEIRSVNPMFEKIVGRTKEELHGLK